jgi:hypothetical protein
MTTPACYMTTPSTPNTAMVDALREVWGPLQKGAARTQVTIGQEAACPACLHQRLSMASWRLMVEKIPGMGRTYIAADYDPYCLIDATELNDSFGDDDERTRTLEPLGIALAEVWGDTNVQHAALDWLMVAVLRALLPADAFQRVDAARALGRTGVAATVLKLTDDEADDMVLDLCREWRSGELVYANLSRLIGFSSLQPKEMWAAPVTTIYLDAIQRAQRGERAFPV